MTTDKEPKICQSCAMPLEKEEDKGTESNGNKSEKFCCFCYEKGTFTEDLTLEQMIEKLVSMAKEMGMTENEARNMAMEILPTLKRWEK